MRGYEELTDWWFHSHIARYESPCGVMSVHAGYPLHPPIPLRIPMRGYETLIPTLDQLGWAVTNPHAGL